MKEAERKEIICLYKKGNSISEVAEKVDYHRSTVHRVVSDEGIVRSMSEGSKGKNLSEEHKKKISESLKGVERERQNLKKGFEKITEDLGYFLGVMEGDGYIVSSSGIGLENKDKEFIDEFAEAIENQLGLEPNIYEREADEMEDWRTGKTHERSKRWVLRKHSKNLLDFCENLIGSEWILDRPEEVRIAWIRGLWDSDGCVSPESQQVYLYNKEERLIKLYCDILEDILGIETKYYQQENGVYKAYFGRQEQMKTFYKQVKPTIQRKRQNFQELLDHGG